MAQILINSRMCATGHRPICQDTGIVTVFVRVGMDVRWDGATMGLDDMINEGVRRAMELLGRAGAAMALRQPRCRLPDDQQPLQQPDPGRPEPKHGGKRADHPVEPDQCE